MSGPKYYDVSVFDKSLSDMFKLQSKIECFLEELSHLSVSDERLGIHFDCKGIIELHKEKSRELLKKFSLGTDSRITASEHQKYKKKITKKLKELEEFITTLKREIVNFESRKEDYKSYVDYDEYYDMHVSSINEFKADVINYLKKYVGKEHKRELAKAEKEIEAITIKAKKADFKFNFKSEVTRKKEIVLNEANNCETKISSFRRELSDEVFDNESQKKLESLSQETGRLQSSENKEETVKNQVLKINQYIDSVNSYHRQNEYRKKLKNLEKSESLKGIYFYEELLQSIKLNERTLSWKSEIKDILVVLNQFPCHKELDQEKKDIIKYCNKMIMKNNLKACEYEDIKVKFHKIKQKNEEYRIEELIRERKRQFIKEHLIKELEKMDYQIMTDMEVIDFENDHDLLFKVPYQDNYMNLKFEDNGGLKYKFMIPENRKDLSDSEKAKKLEEMQLTCDEFKKILGYLRGLGLNFNLNREMPVAEEKLISVPKKHREKIKKEIKKTRKMQEKKKRYLD